MKNFLQFFTVFLFSTFLIYSQSDCTPISEVKFPGGRVVMSFDGNVHDDDDIVAMGLSAGLWWAAGLQDKVVQIEYNNHVCSINVVESDGTGPGTGYDGQNMRTTASGAISNFGYNPAVFYDYERVGSTSTNKMASEIEKSTSSNPLWIIAAGPMETVWRGLEKATKGHANVTIISHSKWNQDHEHCTDAHNWVDLKNKYQSKGVFFVENCTGSNCSSNSGLNDQNGGFNSAISNWTWLRDSPDQYNRWIFSRNPFGSYFDPSDAGMSYYLITGGPFNGGNKSANHNDARKLMENPCLKPTAPQPGNAPSLTITSPTQDQVFELGKEVTVQLNTNDNNALVKHQIFVNNVLVDTDGTNYTPYTFKIDTKAIYSIRAEVTDNTGAKSTEKITIIGGTDDNDKTDPLSPPVDFDISSPSEGEVFKIGKTITVNLVSGATAIVQHKIFVNDRLVDTDGSKFTPHRISNAQVGSYIIRGEVTKSDGTVTTKSVKVTVMAGDDIPDTQNPPIAGAPEFNFKSPIDGQSLAAATNIPIDLVVTSAASKIVKYEIFVNDKLVDTDGSKFTPHIIRNAVNGIYIIKAKVTSENGKSTIKDISVNVGNDGDTTTPGQSEPITMSVSPANGATFAEGSTVIVNVSANSSAGRIVKYQIFVDGTLVDTDGAYFTPYTVNNILKGNHTIFAEVTDDSGNKKSQTSQITVGMNASTSLVARLSNSTVGLVENDLPSSPQDKEFPSMRIVQNPIQSANLQVDLNRDMDLIIIDLNGLVVKKIEGAKNRMNLDVSGLAPGLYILKSANETAKFIVPRY